MSSRNEDGRSSSNNNNNNGGSSSSSSSSSWNYYIPFCDPKDDDTNIDNDIENQPNLKQTQIPTEAQSTHKSATTKTPPIQQQWKAFWSLSLPYFYDPNDSEGRCLFLGLIILMLLDSFARIFFSYLARDFWSALGDKDEEQFYHVLQLFAVALLILSPINVFYRFQRQRLAIKWRKWMTHRILSLYFYNPHQIYYQLEQRQQVQQSQGRQTQTATATLTSYHSTKKKKTANTTTSTNHSSFPSSSSYVDNPDQRLAEDVRSFTQYSLSLFLTIAISVIDLTAFSVVLYTIEPMLFLSIIGFATFGTLMTVLLGRDLVQLNFERLQKEADFRFSLIRIRENAESIAFFRGEQTEGYEIQQRFTNVVYNMYDIIGIQRNLEFFTTSYNYLTWILPVVVIAPQYMMGNVELGVVQQAAGAFAHILDDLSLIINSFEDLSEFSASIGRLHQFVSAIQDVDPDRDEYSPLLGSSNNFPPPPDDANDDNNNTHYENSYKGSSDGIFNKNKADTTTKNYDHHCGGGGGSGGGISLRQLAPYSRIKAGVAEDDDNPENISSSAAAVLLPLPPPLSIRNLCLYTPDSCSGGDHNRRRRTLLYSLDLELQWGQKLLIIGPSGIGKSSLLRAIAGLWTAGSGIIERANTADVYFLPQKPYSPIGSLRDQLLYPFRSSTNTKTNTNTNANSTNNNININNGSSSSSVVDVVVSDERLLQILDDVDLGQLATRYSTTTVPSGGKEYSCNDNDHSIRNSSSGLDAIVDWGNVLSLGEQQRLAFGRVLVNQPRLVIVDEATSAMDVTAEEKMYGLLQNMNDVTYVSVGHRPTLLKYHNKKLHLHKMEENKSTTDNDNQHQQDSHCNYTFGDIHSSTTTGVTNDEVNLFFR